LLLSCCERTVPCPSAINTKESDRSLSFFVSSLSSVLQHRRSSLSLIYSPSFPPFRLLLLFLSLLPLLLRTHFVYPPRPRPPSPPSSATALSLYTSGSSTVVFTHPYIRTSTPQPQHTQPMEVCHSQRYRIPPVYCKVRSLSLPFSCALTPPFSEISFAPYAHYNQQQQQQQHVVPRPNLWHRRPKA
jgi:hypothetical protein